jgi:hypothetical protein
MGCHFFPCLTSQLLSKQQTSGVGKREVGHQSMGLFIGGQLRDQHLIPGVANPPKDHRILKYDSHYSNSQDSAMMADLIRTESRAHW